MLPCREDNSGKGFRACSNTSTIIKTMIVTSDEAFSIVEVCQQYHYCCFTNVRCQMLVRVLTKTLRPLDCKLVYYEMVLFGHCSKMEATTTTEAEDYIKNIGGGGWAQQK
ncbi:hypothetical protein TNCV_3510381 [Trichonephila clavipes]|nr:hypothetical protein TNCV_3510381 [Trichonephila clavipes]